MHAIGIATYSVRVRRKREQEPDLLGAIDGRLSLRRLISDYLQSIGGEHAVDADAQLVLQCTRRETDSTSCWGILESGDYGFEARGVNVRTRRETYRRSPQDAETIPFYYRAYLPDDRDLGILLLQRHGARGVFTTLVKGLRLFLDDRLPDHVLDINRLVPAEVVRHLTEGNIRAITVVAHTLPDDLADKLRFLGNRREIGTFVIEAKARRNHWLTVPGWLAGIRDGRTQIVELPVDLRETDARIRLRIEYGGVTRVVDLSDPASIAPYVDATDDLEIAPTGHPVFGSIDDYASRLLQGLLAQLGRA